MTTLAAVLVFTATLAEPLAVLPGPHAVGFRIVEHQDPARRTPAGGVWPVQIGLWYPAQAGGGPSLHYRDYVIEGARILPASKKLTDGETLAGYVAFLEKNGIPRAGIDAWLASPMLSVRDAAPREGAFPVVLLAQGMGGVLQDQACFAEYLASHGYIVVTTPSPVRLGLPMETEADVPVMARNQARDLAMALERMRGWPALHLERVGIAGYSFGGRSALVLAGMQPDAGAVVSLDGGIASPDAKGWLTPGDLDRGAFRVPILHVGHDTTLADAAPLHSELLESLRQAPRTIVEVKGLQHLELMSYGVAAGRIGALQAVQPDRLAERVTAAMTLTRAFFDAHLKGERGRWEAIAADPVAGGGYRAGLLSVTVLGPPHTGSPAPSPSAR